MVNSYKEARATLSEPAQLVYDGLQAIYGTDLGPSSLANVANSINSGLIGAANLEADFLGIKREENGIGGYGTLVQKALAPLESSPLRYELATQGKKTLEEIGHSLGIGATVLSTDSYAQVVAVQNDVSSLANLDDYHGLVDTLETLIDTYSQKAREHGEMMRDGIKKRQELGEALREQKTDYDDRLAEKDAFVEKLRESIQKIRAEKEGLAEIIERKETDYAILTTEKKDLGHQLAEKEKEYSALEKKSKDQMTTIERLTERLGQYEAETGKSSKIGFAGRYLAATREIKRLEKEVAGYKANQDVDVDRLKVERDELAAKVETLEASLEQYKQGTQVVRKKTNSEGTEEMQAPEWKRKLPGRLMLGSLATIIGVLYFGGEPKPTESNQPVVTSIVTAQGYDAGVAPISLTATTTATTTPTTTVVYTDEEGINYTLSDLIKSNTFANRCKDALQVRTDSLSDFESALSGEDPEALQKLTTEYPAIVSRGTCDAEIEKAKASQKREAKIVTKTVSPRVSAKTLGEACKDVVYKNDIAGAKRKLKLR